jgi:hypothetical protein
VVLVSRRYLESAQALAGAGGRLRLLGGDDRALIDVYELASRDAKSQPDQSLKAPAAGSGLPIYSVLP